VNLAQVEDYLIKKIHDAFSNIRLDGNDKSWRLNSDQWIESNEYIFEEIDSLKTIYYVTGLHVLRITYI